MYEEIMIIVEDMEKLKEIVERTRKGVEQILAVQAIIQGVQKKWRMRAISTPERCPNDRGIHNNNNNNS